MAANDNMGEHLGPIKTGWEFFLSQMDLRWTKRLDDIEVKQEKRHDENRDSIRSLYELINPVVNDVGTLIGSHMHPGRMGDAERDIKEQREDHDKYKVENAVEMKDIKKAVDKINNKLAFYAGGIAIIVIVANWYFSHKP